MKQLTITKYGNADEAFSLEDKADLVPKERDLLIAVEGFGLNFADVMARNGLYKDAPKIPFVPGYEVVGKVVGKGDLVPEEFAGQRVVAFTRFGGYASQTVADFRGAAVIDASIPGGEACALATQYCTAYYMTDYSGRMHAGETALIHACAGGVGVALTQLCHRQGVRVIGLCSSPEKVAFLQEQGVEIPINYKANAYKDVIENQLGKRKVDYVFNTVAGKTFKNDLSLLAYGGRIFCFGGAARSGKKGHLINDVKFLLQTGFVSPLFMMMKSQGVIGVNMLRLADNNIGIIGSCLRDLVGLHAAGTIKPVVGATFEAAAIAEAHTLLESGKSTGKIYVTW
nr:zinc-binding dehydrogenase [Cytophagales bacterium]